MVGARDEARDALLRRAEPCAVSTSKRSVGKRWKGSKRRYEYEFAVGPEVHTVSVTLSRLSGKRALAIDGKPVRGFATHHSAVVSGAHTIDVAVAAAVLGRSFARVDVDGARFASLAVGRPRPLDEGRAETRVVALRLAAATPSLLDDERRRLALAAAAPPAVRERALERVHVASADGYDVGRALDAFPATTDAAAVVVVRGGAAGATFGCFLSRLPTKGDRRPTSAAFLFRFGGPEPEVWAMDPNTADPAAVVVAARTDAFLAVGLDAHTATAALRLDASLSSGSSDASPLFGSPRLHGAADDAFDVLDFELYALRPHGT